MKHWPKLTPPQIITLSFALMILVGAGLLSLPAASASGKSAGFCDALFTAASANCVTGLAVLNTKAQWSAFGKLVILALIQLGGLGLVAVMTAGMTLIKRKVSIEGSLLIQASFNQDNFGGMASLAKLVVKTTLMFEGIGAVLLTLGFYFTPGTSPTRALWLGVFHAVSAFCNAGFDIIGNQGLTPFQGNYFINITLIALMVSGGLGFTVWGEIFAKQKRRFSLHAKTAIASTTVLLLSGAILFLLFEWSNPKTLGAMPGPEKALAALFQSATLRTCGFNTISQGGLEPQSKLLSCLLMMVGGSPASAAGGIKTVTLCVIVFSMVSVIKGKKRIEAFGRTIPLELLQKALTVSFAMALVALVSTFILCYTEKGLLEEFTLMDLVYESISATGTAGLTTGITPLLSSTGKLVITICMFIGRLSPVTVAVSLNMKLGAESGAISYP
ncbi:MAG: Trk family potassium uptake protein, partial [Clostridiales bacterium]|nr:Trk family potassium uptake protein [Clostridiales bacterium]